MPHNIEIEIKADEFKKKLNIKDGKDGVEGPIGPQGPPGRTIKGKPGKDAKPPTKTELRALIRPLIPDPIPGEDGADGSPDTPIEIRDKLETLDGNYRLDAKAIKNLPNLIVGGNERRPFIKTISDTASVDLTVAAANLSATVLPAGVDHNSLANLTVGDVHTQYALLAGRAGGQILRGGTAATDGLTLRTTSGVGAAGADMIFQGGNNGATEFARFLNSGFFGIGTTSPGRLFTVFGPRNDTFGRFHTNEVGTAISSGLEFGNNNAGAFQQMTKLQAVDGNFDFTNMLTGAANNINFKTAGDATANIKMVIVNAGSVGIGTTSPAINGDTRALTISGGTSGTVTAALELQGSRVVNTAQFAVINFYHQANRVAFIDSLRADADNSGELRLITANAGVLGVAIRINQSGSVFIGSSSATAKLHIQAGTATASTAPLKFTSGTNLTAAENGAMEYNGTNLFFTRTGAVREGIITESAINVVSPTAPNRTITVNIDGSTYYIAAKTTND